MSASKRFKAQAGVEDELDVPIEQGSMCPVCLQLGVELKYRTRVQWWRGGQLVVMSSFNCQSCHFKNKQCDAVGANSGRGVKCVLKLPKGAEGLVHQKREIIKSEHASLEIPEIGFEMPPRTDKGFMRSVEAVLEGARANLRTMLSSGEQGEAIAKFIEELDDCIYGDREWTLVIDDPSGNSYIEPNGAADADPALEVTEYERSPTQAAILAANGVDEQGMAAAAALDGMPQ